MERLTHIDHIGWYINRRDGSRIRGSHINRLAAYENTGLAPEEIKDSIGWMSPVCVRCDGKTNDGIRTEKCGYPDNIAKCLEQSKHLLELAQAEQDGRLIELPFVAMVEQSLQDGKMKPIGGQKHNGRYAVVYVDRNKWKSPLIDICGKPYQREEAEIRMAELAGKGGDV